MFILKLIHVHRHSPPLNQHPNTSWNFLSYCLQMQRSEKQPADYLAELPAEPVSLAQQHNLLKSEMERVAAGEKLQAMDVQRYNLEPPPAAKRSDPAAWGVALDNAYAQLEHQYNRLVNLELMLKFGPDVWRAHNEAAASHVEMLQTKLTETRKATDALNQERNLQQTAAGRELRALEHEYLSLVMKNADIDLACRQLEGQVEAAQAGKGL